MAISNRVQKNASGQIMVPMNMEGTSYDQNFISTGKIGVLVALLVCIVFAVMQVHKFIDLTPRIIGYVAIVFVAQLVIRKAVFQEDYYAKIYKQSQKYTVTTPEVFWNIPNIQDTYRGAYLMYADGKTGVIIRAERDTITGKTADFVENHYDAISDFYKTVNQHKLCSVTMNIMEPAGKDPRIDGLDSLVTAPSNPNLAKIMEMQVGEIRKTTRETLYETEYFLIYSREGTSVDKLMAAAQECAAQLLNGAYVGFTVLDRRECTDLMRELYGVGYFDYGKAAVSVFKNSGIAVNKAIELKEIRYTDGEVAEVDRTGNIRLSNLASYVSKGDLQPGEWTVQDALAGRIKNKNIFGGQPASTQQKVSAAKKTEDIGEVYLNLDEDIFEEYVEPTEPELDLDKPVESEDKKSSRKFGFGGKKNKDKATKKKKKKGSKVEQVEEAEDEILVDSEENFPQFGTEDGPAILLGSTDGDDIIDL